MSGKLNVNSVSKFITGKWFIFVLCALIFIFFSIVSPAVCTVDNIRNILVSTSITAIAGAGMTFAITLGGFDLSVGSVLALTTCVIAELVPTMGILGAITVAFAIAALVGLVNGLIITKLKIQTFVATLATQIIIQGIALIYTKGVSVPIFRYTDMKVFSAARVLGIPLPVLIAVLVYIICAFLYQECKFGIYLRAAGSNEKAARLSAIPVMKITIVVFIMTAVTAAVSGLITVSQILTGGAVYGSDFAISAITVVVLGGTSLKGGSGFLAGTLIATIMISVIENGLTILGYSDDTQRLIIGLILIASLTIRTFMAPLASKKGAR
jgi:ribose/xylose/arabinose/galactoside ABC-type transport system permease subunit